MRNDRLRDDVGIHLFKGFPVHSDPALTADRGNAKGPVEELVQVGVAAPVEGFEPYPFEDDSIELVFEGGDMFAELGDDFSNSSTVNQDAPQSHFQRRSLQRSAEFIGAGGMIVKLGEYRRKNLGCDRAVESVVDPIEFLGVWDRVGVLFIGANDPHLSRPIVWSLCSTFHGPWSV